MKVPNILQQPLDNIIKKEGYVTYEVNVQEVGADGSSFMSKAYTANVKGKTAQGEKETKLFVKCIIPTEHLEDLLNVPQAYASEAFVYNELSKVFEDLQDDAKIPPAERFKLIKSYGESNSEVTILENVAVKGYKTCDRTYMMSLEVAEMSLKELAKYHAFSFVVKAKKPQYYKEKIEGFKHPSTFSTSWKDAAVHVAKMAAKYMKDGSREKLEKFLENYSSKWMNYEQNHTWTKRCLIHGDFRLNNILMKYNGDKLEDLFIVDYQLMSFGCPINDFLFFIFTGTDQKFRRQHLNHLRYFYYKSFTDFLKLFHLDSREIYPKEEFERDYKERLDYGLIVALYFMPFFLADEGAIPDLGTKPITEMDFAFLDDFTPRMQGIVDDFIDWGYL